jgi:hypothetical protein
LLGFYFGDGISHELVLKGIQDKLAEQIQIAKNVPYGYMERVVVLNQMFMGTIWYKVALWKGGDKDLKNLESDMVRFLWAGQKYKAHPRVRLDNLIKRPAKGGVGLISLRAQVKSFAGKIILWTMSKGDHPLQVILRRRLRDMSQVRWGVHDFLWVFNPGRLTSMERQLQGESLWGNIIGAWTETKGLI